jgi:hypothetical protein
LVVKFLSQCHLCDHCCNSWCFHTFNHFNIVCFIQFSWF